MQEKKRFKKKPIKRGKSTEREKPFEGNPFDLEEQFKQYLKKMNIEALVPGSRPYIEIKRGFYGGMGSFYIFFLEVITTLPEEDGIEAMARLRSDMQRFWANELGKTFEELTK